MTLAGPGRMALAALMGLTLGACGTDREESLGVSAAKLVSKELLSGRKPAAAGVGKAPGRAELAAYNTPMIMVESESTGARLFLVPTGQNSGVDTWSTTDDQSLSFRDGVLVASRGFGPDLMQAAAPSRAQIASGQGSHRRSYFYLDGADQTQRIDYQCSILNMGSETITVVERQHSTRHVAETCHSDTHQFTNEYWVENGGKIRKSKELLVSAWGPVTVFHVIDK